MRAKPPVAHGFSDRERRTARRYRRRTRRVAIVTILCMFVGVTATTLLVNVVGNRRAASSLVRQ
jgi:hypothetical protein